MYNHCRISYKFKILFGNGRGKSILFIASGFKIKKNMSRNGTRDKLYPGGGPCPIYKYVNTTRDSILVYYNNSRRLETPVFGILIIV